MKTIEESNPKKNEVLSDEELALNLNVTDNTLSESEYDRCNFDVCAIENLCTYNECTFRKCTNKSLCLKDACDKENCQKTSIECQIEISCTKTGATCWAPIQNATCVKTLCLKTTGCA